MKDPELLPTFDPNLETDSIEQLFAIYPGGQTNKTENLVNEKIKEGWMVKNLSPVQYGEYGITVSVLYERTKR